MKLPLPLPLDLSKLTGRLILALLVGLTAFTSYQDNNPLQGGPGIVQAELAGTIDRAEVFMDQWRKKSPDYEAKLRQSLFWDNWFIPCYALLFTLLVSTATRYLGIHSPALERWGALVAWGQLAAGIFDWVENFALYQFVGAPSPEAITQPWPAIACAAASCKFALLAVGALLVLPAIAKALGTTFGWIRR